MTQQSLGSSKRGRGRPRHDGSAADGPPRDAIIRAATALFGDRGYASTTITEIATAAGLQQSSVYYYFRSKEDILHATLALNRQALAFAAKLGSGQESSVAVKLYRLLRFDTLQLCLSPFDFNEIERLAENQPVEFAAFWHDYRELHQRVRDFIVEGIKTREFKPCDTELAATSALCLNEGIQKRYRGQDRHGADSGSPFALDRRLAEDYANASATTSLLALLTRRANLPSIQKRADASEGPAARLRQP